MKTIKVKIHILEEVKAIHITLPERIVKKIKGYKIRIYRK